MVRKHEYDDIPGTYVFDAERSREGYGINMFCMSLMQEDNRTAFKADEPGISEEVQAHAGADRHHPQA
jgi:protocatechuate 4,5-dioxygenase, alpha chain